MLKYCLLSYILFIILLNYYQSNGQQRGNSQLNCRNLWNRYPCITSLNSSPNRRTNNGQSAQHIPNRQSSAKHQIGRQTEMCRTTGGIGGECLFPTHCFSQFNNVNDYTRNLCRRMDGSQGICCPKSIIRNPVFLDIELRIPVPFQPRRAVTIDAKYLDEAIDAALANVSRQMASERTLIRSGFHQRRGSSESFHQAFFGPDTSRLRKNRNDGKLALEVSLHLAKRLNLSPIQARDGLLGISLQGTRLSDRCLVPARCQPNSRYRTIDGSCNNIANPLWGRSLTQFQRLLPANYADGLNDLRNSVEERSLPTPRELSNMLTVDGEVTDKTLSVMFMQWGQFMDHDMTLGASTRADTGEGLVCCNRTQNGELVNHPACKPILLSRNDPFYGPLGQTCNNFVRNSVAVRYDCNLGFREQTNVITHFMDASMVYGNTDNRSRIVRTFQNGRLLTSRMNGNDFLPFDTMNNSLACNIPRTSGMRCVFAGDVRVNQQLGLTNLQLIFLREHNRIAGELKKVNPNWNDETLFQETRRIIGAIVQSISYNEWLPLVLGRSLMNAFGLLPKPTGFTYDYNPDLNPAIFNEFATAAFRWHTLVQGFYNFMDLRGRSSRMQMRDVFNNPSVLYRKGAVDEALRGVTNQASQAFDPTVSVDIKDHLFPVMNSPFGMDLISINIQRGRDHGLPTYNHFREVCGLPRVRDFNQLDRVLRRGSAQRFSQIYRNIDDIDLFIAGFHEIPLKEGILGPTFACIVAEQFRRTKLGDRFWFENGNMAHSFTEAQLNEIRKISLSSLICLNGDDIRDMQPLSLIIPNNAWNMRTECSKFPKLNFDHWNANRGVSQLRVDYDYPLY